MRDGSPIISENDRNQYHQEYDLWYWYVARVVCGLYYRTIGALKAGVGIRGFLAVVYLGANIVILITIFFVTLNLWEEREVWWLLPISHATAAVLIVLYNVVWHCLNDTTHEVERRQIIAEMLRESAFNPENSRPERVCDAVLRDMQETLRVNECQARVMLIAYSETWPDYSTPEPKCAASEYGYVWKVARDHRPREDGWLEKTQPAMASFAYECIRLREDIVFHDHRSRLFRRWFGEYKRSDVRSFLYLLLCSEGGRPVGILALMSEVPYSFWPKSRRVEDLTARLLMYRRLAAMWCEKEVDERTAD